MKLPLDYVPYTYLIGWSHLDRWYYGCQYRKTGIIANPNNLWKTYFTSSKYVDEFRKHNGEPDVVEVRKTFITTKECVAWESRVLTKINAVENEKWLNKTDCNTRFLISDVGREKISLALRKQKGIPKPKGFGKKISETLKGRISPTKGIRYPKEYYTKERIERMRVAQLNQEKQTCPVCSKTMNISNFKKYGHGNTCIPKEKKKTFNRIYKLEKDGNVYEFENMSKFCREHNLTIQLVWSVLRNVQHHHKGFRRVNK